MNDSTTKRCTKCGADKPLSEFQRNRSTPDGLQRWCASCRREHALRPDRAALKHQYDQDRYHRMHDQLLEQKRAYFARPDIKTIRKQYNESRRNDPVRLALQRARHYRRWADPAYRAKDVAKRRKRRHADIGYRQRIRLWQRQRKQRIMAQGVPFTHDEWIALCEQYNHQCLACGKQTTLTVDHVKPLTHGGSSGIENIQPLCIDCNRKKHARHIDYRH